MDENTNFPKDNISNATKASLDSELDAFINPQKGNAPVVDDTKPISVAPIHTPINLSSLGEATTIKSPIAQKPLIRTYKSDLEETIQSGHLSSINIAISQNKKSLQQSKTEIEEVKKSKINKNIVIISLVLIVGGALTFAIPYLLVQKQNAPVVTPVDVLSVEPLITTDVEEKINTKDINLNRVSLTLAERVDQSSTKLGQIKDFFLTQGNTPNETPITAIEFIKLIKGNIPSDLERTLKPKYMFGMHNFNGNQKFLILTVGSYDVAYSGMLAWEDNLWQDFKDLFALQDTAAVAPVNTNIGTSTTQTNPDSLNTFIVESKKFQDATFSNKDSRVVKGSDGKIIFLYSIIDNNTIVITTSVDTLKEIVSRINRGKGVAQ